MTAILPIELVVGAHHRGGTFVHAAFEMRQVDLVQHPFTRPDIDLEACPFDAVGGKMLDAGHDVTLHAAHQRRSHLAEMVRILAVGLLCPTPGGVTQQVDAHATEVVGTLGTRFHADGIPDALLQVHVPRGAARHRDRETGGVIHDHTARPIAEADAGDAQAQVLASRQRFGVVGACHLDPAG